MSNSRYDKINSSLSISFSSPHPIHFPTLQQKNQLTNKKAKLPPSQSKIRNPLQPRISLRRNLNPQPPTPLPNPHRLQPNTLRSPCGIPPLLPLRILDPEIKNNNNKHLLLGALKTSLQRLPRAANKLHKLHLPPVRKNRSLHIRSQ